MVSAYRERIRGRIRVAPAWADLDPDGRRETFDRTMESRAFEAALHPSGLSGTGQAVLARLRQNETS